jgi:hypothetical protein
MLPVFLAACSDDAASPDASPDGTSIGRQIGEGYLDNLREAEAASNAAADRVRAFEDLDARLRDEKPTQ